MCFGKFKGTKQMTGIVLSVGEECSYPRVGLSIWESGQVSQVLVVGNMMVGILAE